METVHGFVVTTVCKTVDEFVERYHHRVSGRAMFVGVVEPRALGRESAFAMMLADHQVVLAGVCEVVDIYPDARNQYGRRGMRFVIRRLGEESEEVWSKLVARAEVDAVVEAAIDAATSGSVISSNDLSAYAIEFEEQTTVPLHPRAAN